MYFSHYGFLQDTEMIYILTNLKSHPRTTETYQNLPQLYILYAPHYVWFQVSKVAWQFFLDFIPFEKSQTNN